MEINNNIRVPSVLPYFRSVLTDWTIL